MKKTVQSLLKIFPVPFSGGLGHVDHFKENKGPESRFPKQRITFPATGNVTERGRPKSQALRNTILNGFFKLCRGGSSAFHRHLPEPLAKPAPILHLAFEQSKI